MSNGKEASGGGRGTVRKMIYSIISIESILRCGRRKREGEMKRVVKNSCCSVCKSQQTSCMIGRPDAARQGKGRKKKNFGGGAREEQAWMAIVAFVFLWRRGRARRIPV